MNRPAFAEAEIRLLGAGYDVINPAALPDLSAWHTNLRRDLVLMLQHADGVALLTGWSNSAGAIIEVNTATAIRIHTQLVDRWLEVAN